MKQKLEVGVNLATNGLNQWKSLSAEDRTLVGVNRQAPMPLNAPTLDVSPFGCRHMAANGREFTNSIWQAKTLVSDGLMESDRNKVSIELRGKSYRSSAPSFWSFGAKPAGSQELGIPYLDRDLDIVRYSGRGEKLDGIGFRVVIRVGTPPRLTPFPDPAPAFGGEGGEGVGGGYFTMKGA